MPADGPGARGAARARRHHRHRVDRRGDRAGQRGRARAPRRGRRRAWRRRCGAPGSLFVGPWSAQVAGDYAIGSNHVLPTAGAARVRGGLSAADFVRQITVQRLTQAGLRAHRPDASSTWRRAEGLTAHAASRASIARSRRHGHDRGLMRIQGYPDPGDGLRLHLNENTGGCSPRVLEAIRRVRADDVSTYPSYPALVRAVRAPLRRRSRLGAADQRPRRRHPDGGGRPHRPRARARRRDDHAAAGVRPVSERHGRRRRHGGSRAAAARTTRFQTDAVLAAITPRTKMIFLNTPNNPTGQLIPLADLQRIADAAPHAVVLIDEAYIEFGGTVVPARAAALSRTCWSGGRSRRRTAWPACASASSSVSRRRSIRCAR